MLQSNGITPPKNEILRRLPAGARERGIVPTKNLEDLARKDWLSLPEARTLIARYRHGSENLEYGDGDKEIGIVEVVKREHLEQADQDLWDALKKRKLIAYYRENKIGAEPKVVDAKYFKNPKVWKYVINLKRQIPGIIPHAANELANVDIELAEDDLLEWLGVRTPTKGGRPRIVSEEFEDSKFPYLAFMVEAARKGPFSTVGKTTKKVIEAWLEDNWPEELGESTPTKIGYMATLLRRPSDERGGYPRKRPDH
jgi:hypothetical protein